MEYSIDARCVITLEHQHGAKTSTLKSTDFGIEVRGTDPEAFETEEGLTANGTRAITQCFLQGLVANIHNAHQNGQWDSAEHLRYIIKELERGFVEPVTPYRSTFKF